MTSKRRGAKGIALAFPLVVAAVALAACSSSSTPAIGGLDAGPTFDASPTPVADGAAPATDAPSGTDAASTCSPGNVKSYVPKWTPPKAPQSACSQDELTSYGNCLDSNDSTSAACAPWFGEDASASSSCKTCVADSKSTDPAWGPIVDVGTAGSDRQLNVSGCLAIALPDPTGSGCAGSFQALQECEAAACADNCQGASSTALGSCISGADTNGCSNYLTPAQCIYDAGATASQCFGPAQGTFGQRFAAVAAVFCLGSDAGP
jgi:hypothetical protein